MLWTNHDVTSEKNKKGTFVLEDFLQGMGSHPNNGYSNGEDDAYYDEHQILYDFVVKMAPNLNEQTTNLIGNQSEINASEMQELTPAYNNNNNKNLTETVDGDWSHQNHGVTAYSTLWDQNTINNSIQDSNNNDVNNNCDITFQTCLPLNTETALPSMNNFQFTTGESAPCNNSFFNYYYANSYSEKDSDTDSMQSFDQNTTDTIVEEIKTPRRRGVGRPSNKEKRYKTKNGQRNGRLWEFIRDLLLDSKTCPSLLKWENKEEGIFRFVQSDKVARLWGERKSNPRMNYEKLSRAMRYYYKSQVFLPVLGRRLVYRFGPNATGW